MSNKVLVLIVAVLCVAGTLTFGSDRIGVFATQGEKNHELGAGDFREYTVRGAGAMYMQGEASGFFGSASVGLLEDAGDVYSQLGVTGDTLVGAKYESEWGRTGFHFGAGVNASLESYSLQNSNGNASNLALGVGAVSGVQYYLTDSVAVFMSMQAGFSPFAFGNNSESEAPKRANSVLFQGGMSF